MKELGIKSTSDLELIKDIQERTATIQRMVHEMLEARKVANKIEDQRQKAIVYHDTLAL